MECSEKKTADSTRRGEDGCAIFVDGCIVVVEIFGLNRESKQYIYNCVIEDCKDYYYIYRTDPERALGVFALKDNKASKRKSDGDVAQFKDYILFISSYMGKLYRASSLTI
jgi:hypothetical protein